VDFNDETNELSQSDIDQLEQIIKFALNKENIPSDSEVSVSFVTDDRIRQLNAEYRNINEPTDVLSFPLEESLKDRVESISPIPLVLGDIIVSVQRASEQANTYNHTFKRELSFLVVHGLLHLLGYTHDTEEDEKEMFSKQDKILGEFNIER